MKNVTEKEMKYALILLFLLMPQFVLMHPLGTLGTFYDPDGGMGSYIFWICCALLPSFLVYSFVKREQRVSKVIVLETVILGIVYACFLQKEMDIRLFCAGATLLVLLELFPLLLQWKMICPEEHNYFALVYFWAVMYMFALQCFLDESDAFRAIGIIVFTAPFPIIMGILPGFLKKPLTRRGWICVLIVMILSILTGTRLFLDYCWGIYLAVILIGFTIMSARLWGRDYSS